jgi:hypothetical protein
MCNVTFAKRASPVPAYESSTGGAFFRMSSSASLTIACDHGQDCGLSSIRKTGGLACGAMNVA